MTLLYEARQDRKRKLFLCWASKKAAAELLLPIFHLASITTQKAPSNSQKSISLRTNTLENYDDYKSPA